MHTTYINSYSEFFHCQRNEVERDRERYRISLYGDQSESIPNTFYYIGSGHSKFFYYNYFIII